MVRLFTLAPGALLSFCGPLSRALPVPVEKIHALTLKRFILIVLFLLPASQSSVAGHYEVSSSGILLGALTAAHILNSSYKPLSLMCHLINPEDYAVERPVREYTFISYPSSPVSTQKNRQEHTDYSLSAEELPVSLKPLTPAGRNNDNCDDEDDDPQPPNHSILICKICKNRQAAPGENCCRHCLSERQTTALTRGATLPACVRCGKYRDGKVIENQWVCSDCIVPMNDLMGGAGLYGQQECMVCSDEGGDLQPLACGDGLLVHPGCLEQIPGGLVLCPHCRKKVGIVAVDPVIGQEELVHPSSSDSGWEMLDDRGDVLICHLSEAERLAIAQHHARLLLSDGIRVTAEDILQLFYHNPSLTPKLAYICLPAHFSDPEYQRARGRKKCCIQ